MSTGRTIYHLEVRHRAGAGVNPLDSNSSTGGGGKWMGDGTHQGLQVFTMAHLSLGALMMMGMSSDPRDLDAILPALPKRGAETSNYESECQRSYPDGQSHLECYW